MTAAPAFASRRRPSTELSASSAAADSNGLLEQQGGLSAALNSLDQTQIDMAVQRAVERLSGSDASTDVDAAAMSRAIQEEVHSVFESELAAVHTAFEQEMVNTKQTVKDAVDAAMQDGTMKFDVTANVNTVMAITAVIAYWRGVGGLLDILFEDSLEGYVACVAFGWLIILLIKVLKLPVVEGNSLGL